MAGFEDDFDGIENAEDQASKDGAFLTPGEYELKVEKITYFKSKKGPERYTCGEFTVLSSAGEKALPAGARAKHLILMGGFYSKGNCKSLFSAVIGEPAPKKEEIQEAIGPTQPCKGQVVKARAYNSPNKSGGDFTAVSYSR